MVKIEIKKDEPIDKALRRFKSRLRKEGTIDELKRREHYEKPSERKRREQAVAVRREHRRRRESE